MQPTQPPAPIDYLNEIAPIQPKPGMDNKKFLAIIGGALLIVIIVVIAIASMGGGANSLQTLGLRLQTTQEIADDAQKDLKSSNLRSINSNLVIYLANTNRDIADPLAKNDIDLKKVDKKILMKESGDELTQTLEDAKLNAVYDRVYAKEMTARLTSISDLMNKIYRSTNSTSLKKFLESSDKDLQVLRKQFSEFNSTTS